MSALVRTSTGTSAVALSVYLTTTLKVAEVVAACVEGSRTGWTGAAELGQRSRAPS
jgi:hypothetical protein